MNTKCDHIASLFNPKSNKNMLRITVWIILIASVISLSEWHMLSHRWSGAFIDLSNDHCIVLRCNLGPCVFLPGTERLFLYFTVLFWAQIQSGIYVMTFSLCTVLRGNLTLNDCVAIGDTPPPSSCFTIRPIVRKPCDAMQLQVARRWKREGALLVDDLSWCCPWSLFQKTYYLLFWETPRQANLRRRNESQVLGFWGFPIMNKTYKITVYTKYRKEEGRFISNNTP